MPKKLTGKTIESIGEFGLINQIKRWLPRAKAPVVAGIGDDTAVFSISPNRYQLLTIDTIVEDIDFKKNQAAPEAIGRKALAVNLSDIAAMGGIPKLAVVSLTLPKKTSIQFVKGFYGGMKFKCFPKMEPPKRPVTAIKSPDFEPVLKMVRLFSDSPRSATELEIFSPPDKSPPTMETLN